MYIRIVLKKYLNKKNLRKFELRVLKLRKSVKIAIFKTFAAEELGYWNDIVLKKALETEEYIVKFEKIYLQS